MKCPRCEYPYAFIEEETEPINIAVDAVMIVDRKTGRCLLKCPNCGYHKYQESKGAKT
jgi:uncharacterized C2H2 Zn-finger protein